MLHPLAVIFQTWEVKESSVSVRSASPRGRRADGESFVNFTDSPCDPSGNPLQGSTAGGKEPLRSRGTLDLRQLAAPCGPRFLPLSLPISQQVSADS